MTTKRLLQTAAAILTFATHTVPALADEPSHVRLRSLTYAGTGCPAGTVAENLSADFRALTLLFDSFVAEVGPYVSRSEARKNCQLNIDLDYPQGWSYALASVEYRGYVSLDTNVSAAHSTAYYHSGKPTQATLQTNLRGPISKDFQLSDQFGLASYVWSPCDARRSLNLNTQIRIDNSRNRHGSGLMTLEYLRSGASHRYGLVWKRC
jgi:hypothetical protein